jgi:hypothetical protein
MAHKKEEILETSVSRGQIALEAVIIIGFVLVLMIPLLYTLFSRVLSVNDELRMLEASRAVETISNTVSTVGVIGPNGTATIEVILPDNVRSLSIGQANNREITMVLSTTLGDIDITRMVIYNVTGAMGTRSGSHNIKITYFESGLPIVVSE